MRLKPIDPKLKFKDLPGFTRIYGGRVTHVCGLYCRSNIGRHEFFVEQHHGKTVGFKMDNRVAGTAINAIITNHAFASLMHKIPVDANANIMSVFLAIHKELLGVEFGFDDGTHHALNKNAHDCHQAVLRALKQNGFENKYYNET